ncbi:UNVERIFIED_CONTAM: putative receptor-like serine/threonine-protein kinase [Sesamum latifolium]|uniref:Receptor-like serine/threonine-protein kinase n=1 Tax=Sesamum latifolium TaxID=2727402 RepID=A0AAW2VFK6_9LAMI
MIPSSPAKILIGISLDADESKELLHWAIEVLAKPGDTLVALHVIGAMPNKKAADGGKSARKYQRQIRQAKSFVISTVGELVKTCQSNEIVIIGPAAGGLKRIHALKTHSHRKRTKSPQT